MRVKIVKGSVGDVESDVNEWIDANRARVRIQKFHLSSSDHVITVMVEYEEIPDATHSTKPLKPDVNAVSRFLYNGDELGGGRY